MAILDDLHHLKVIMYRNKLVRQKFKSKHLIKRKKNKVLNRMLTFEFAEANFFIHCYKIYMIEN